MEQLPRAHRRRSDHDRLHGGLSLSSYTGEENLSPNNNLLSLHSDHVNWLQVKRLAVLLIITFRHL